MSSNEQFEAAVVGAGPAGISGALGLVHAGVRTVLFAPPHQPAGQSQDQRTAALFGCSIDYLENLGVFSKCRAQSTPITGLRIIDDTGGLLRAPESLFSAGEIDQETFGYNIAQSVLVDALRSRAQEVGDLLTIVETEGVVGLKQGLRSVEVQCAEGVSYDVMVVAAADGRNSVCRGFAGIGVKANSFDQVALTTIFDHQRDHQCVSTEFHRRNGPFTVVPMSGRTSSLVWVEKRDIAEWLCQMPLERFRKVLEARLQGLLGNVSSIGDRIVFPLSSSVATVMGKDRVALVGEAAHVLPPIGAQGLNLSLRDGGTLAEFLGSAKERGSDLGGDQVMRDYHRSRWFDVHSRARAVDLLNKSLISSIEPVQLLRGAGLQALRVFGPLRRFVIRQGLGPQGDLPKMMQKPQCGAGVEVPSDGVVRT